MNTFTATLRNGETMEINSKSELTHICVGVTSGKTTTLWGEDGYWAKAPEGVHFFRSQHKSERAAENSLKTDRVKKMLLEMELVTEFYLVPLEAK